MNTSKTGKLKKSKEKPNNRKENFKQKKIGQME